MKRTLGGDRLGSGNKQQIETQGFQRSTHDLSFTMRTTASPGVLIPFGWMVAQPGDDWDIKLDMEIMTHPTLGPLFATYKAQVDCFTSDVRLYNGLLHQNKIGIGNHMEEVKIPQMALYFLQTNPNNPDIDNCQINPSSLLKYTGISGAGYVGIEEGLPATRYFNALPLLMYFDTFKNYYSNKQEVMAYQINQEPYTGLTNVTALSIGTDPVTLNGTGDNIIVNSGLTISIAYSATPRPLDWEIIFHTDQGDLSLAQVGQLFDESDPLLRQFTWKFYLTGQVIVNGYTFIEADQLPQQPPALTPIELAAIDTMKEEILRATQEGEVFFVDEHMGNTNADPYWNVLRAEGTTYMNTQQGLMVKTYQSDLFNNWLETEGITGAGGINEVTKVSTTGNAFTIDAFRLAEKMNKMLNDIYASGGTYDDWNEAAFDETPFGKSETPVYHGSLIKEVIFSTVVSNSASNAEAAGGQQPLGTLAGRGTMAQKHKGGRMSIKTKEHAYVYFIFSLTPRIDYSQGNRWDMNLKNMANFHFPHLDGIGFQDLITDQMNVFDTRWLGLADSWEFKSAGKQPAWNNYRTNIPQTYGNFAIKNSEMFMTLNRQYQIGDTGGGNIGITDLTTYIDPTKYNNIFADTSIDAQNFWVQIAADVTVRRKMSARIMPNL